MFIHYSKTPRALKNYVILPVLFKRIKIPDGNTSAYNMAYYFVSFLRQSSNHSLGTLKGMQANESFIFIKTREQDSLMYLQDLKRSKDVSLISPQRNSSAFFIQELNCQKVSCLPPDVSYLVVTKSGSL